MSILQPHPKSLYTAFAGLIGLLVASCGSYQPASYYDNDGIYGTRTEYGTAARQQQAPRRTAERKNGEFYQNYFGERAQELEQVLDSEVFTDIDAYTSTDSLGVARDSLLGNPNDYLAYDNDYEGYPGWGDQGGDVVVNVYGNNWGWNNWGWNSWGWNSWGWNNWGWYDPAYYYGWGYTGWGRPWRPYSWGGWGWGYAGWYNPWYYGSWYGYGYAYGYPYYGWGYPSYGYRNYASAYNSGRRGYYNRNQSPQNLQGSRYAAANSNARYRTNSGRSNLGSNSRYASSQLNRSRVNADAAARNQAYRTSRTSRTPYNYDGSGRSARSYGGGISSNSTQRYSSPSAYGRSSGSYGNSGSSSSRSSGGNYRNPASTPRSSGGTYRSSGGSSRSSGGSFSSGGGSRSSGGGSRSSGGRSGGGRSNQ